MTSTQRYELIRPILRGEKTPTQVSKETGISSRTLYRYLRRFHQEGAQGLVDKPHAAHSHPHWFTDEQKDIVAQYKIAHPKMSARQIAKQLTDSGQLQISNHSVTNILHERGIPLMFSPSNARPIRSHIGR